MFKVSYFLFSFHCVWKQMAVTTLVNSVHWISWFYLVYVDRQALKSADEGSCLRCPIFCSTFCVCKQMAVTGDLYALNQLILLGLRWLKSADEWSCLRCPIFCSTFCVCKQMAVTTLVTSTHWISWLYLVYVDHYVTSSGDTERIFFDRYRFRLHFGLMWIVH